MRRRIVGSVLAAAMTATLVSGCGNSGTAEQAAESSPAAAEQAPGSPSVNPSDPGDDLLGKARSGVVLKGSDTEVSWRFPSDCYQRSGAQMADCEQGEEVYSLVVGGKPGGVDAVISELRDRTQDVDGKASESEVTVAGRDFTVLAFTSELAGTQMAFAHQPEGSDLTYGVTFMSTAQKPDQRRVDEVYQMLGSLEFEPAG